MSTWSPIRCPICGTGHTPQCTRAPKKKTDSTTRVRKLEKQLRETRSVLADVREARMGCVLFSAQVAMRNIDDEPDEFPDEMLVRAETVEDVLRMIREEHCPIRMSGIEEHEQVTFDVKIWPVADAGPGILQQGVPTEHKLVVSASEAEARAS